MGLESSYSRYEMLLVVSRMRRVWKRMERMRKEREGMEGVCLVWRRRLDGKKERGGWSVLCGWAKGRKGVLVVLVLLYHDVLADLA